MLQEKKPFVYGSSRLFVASAQGPVIIFGWVLICFYARIARRSKHSTYFIHHLFIYVKYDLYYLAQGELK